MVKEKGNSDSFQKRSAGLLKNQVHLLKNRNSERYEIEPIQSHLSFDKGFFIFVRACQMLAQNNDGVVFVGIAGPSGAGKTIFTEKVMSVIPGIAVISMDNYNDASRLIDGNFDDPRLTDYDTLLENLNGLKMGKTVNVPIYDFKTSSRSGSRMVEAPNSRIVIVEGIYALSEKLRPFMDLRVSITGGIHFDLVKRVLRDIQRAGQEPEEIIHQISETVYPMYKAFIEPDLKTAHIKIVNKFNPFAGFQSPTYILKSTKSLSIEQIKAVMPKDVIVKTEEIFDIYLLPPGEDPESCQSYLRMRNRDGIYNLMFEEWVTDNPFIISPRISFEVGVRLLGGLMTLGYTIAAILKRRSNVLSDDKVTVKIDQLAQLNRNYIQVQGKDRASVKNIATELGLDGSYTARTYIEQIQLENLVNEIKTVPDDLKTKLRKYDEKNSSPKDILCMSYTEKTGMQKSMSRSCTVRGESPLYRYINSISARQEFESYDPRNELMDELGEKIVTLTDKMAEFASLAEETSYRQKNLLLEKCISNSPSPKELVNVEEQIMILTKGQNQIIHKLETLSKNMIEMGTLKKKSNRNLDSRQIISIAALGACGYLLSKLYWN